MSPSANNIGVAQNISDIPSYSCCFSDGSSSNCNGRNLIISGGFSSEQAGESSNTNSRSYSSLNIYSSSSEQPIQHPNLRSGEPVPVFTHIAENNFINDAAIHAVDCKTASNSTGQTFVLVGDSLGRTSLLDLNRLDSTSSALWHFPTHIPYTPDLINNPYEETGSSVSSVKFCDDDLACNIFMTSGKDGKIYLG